MPTFGSQYEPVGSLQGRNIESGAQRSSPLGNPEKLAGGTRMYLIPGLRQVGEGANTGKGPAGEQAGGEGRLWCGSGRVDLEVTDCMQEPTGKGMCHTSPVPRTEMWGWRRRCEERRRARVQGAVNTRSPNTVQRGAGDVPLETRSAVAGLLKTRDLLT